MNSCHLSLAAKKALLTKIKCATITILPNFIKLTGLQRGGGVRGKDLLDFCFKKSIVIENFSPFKKNGMVVLDFLIFSMFNIICLEN